MTHIHHQTHSFGSGASTGNRIAFIDAHVHLHRRFDLSVVFDHAAANIARAAAARHLSEDCPGILMLTESTGVDRFGELVRLQGKSIGQWQLQTCDENESLRLIRSTDDTLVVIAGRQIVTRDRLEVLALGTRRRIDDGQATDDTIQEVRRAGALPVLPWGFGKWTRRRRCTMERIIESPLAEDLFLGDNGGRPRFYPTPELFHEARRRSIRLLPGTDPLPFTHQQRRAGRYGFMLPIQADERRPFLAIQRSLDDLQHQPPIYGQRESWFAFVQAQLAMQWYNRTRRPRR